MFKDPIKAKDPGFGHDYDKRSGPFINMGTDYGVGHTNPVGHSSQPKQRVPTMPMTNKKSHEKFQ